MRVTRTTLPLLRAAIERGIPVLGDLPGISGTECGAGRHACISTCMRLPDGWIIASRRCAARDRNMPLRMPSASRRAVLLAAVVRARTRAKVNSCITRA